MYSVTNPSIKISACGGIGRHVSLRNSFFREYKFKSCQAHQKGKNVYSNVYDLGVLSTKKKGEGLVLLRKAICNSLRNLHSSLRNNRAFLTETIKAINIYIIRLLSINNPTTQVCRSCRRFAISTVDIHLCGNNHRKCSHNVYTSTKDTIPITA